MSGKFTKFTPGRGYSKEDWDEVSDSPEITEEEWAQAKPFAEVFPELAATIAEETALAEKRGKELVILEIDLDVLTAFRAAGPDWRDRMSDALRAAISIKA